MSEEMHSRAALASVLDRLLDDDPDALRDPPRTDAARLRAHRAAVLRDLSDLLNTRRALPAIAERHPDLMPSPLHYGLPDPASARLSSAAERERFRQDIEETIRRYEPRFRRVIVRLIDAYETGGAEGSLRLRIEALLHAEPAPLSVTFDSVMDAADGSFAVEDSGS